MPEVPCDPKLVVEPPTDARDLARFALTSLERGPLRDVALGEDAAGAAAAVVSGTGEKSAVGSLAGGLFVSLLTPESYEFKRASAVQQQQQQLSAEDATLLVNAERALATARAAAAEAAKAAAPATAATAVAAPTPIARKPQGKELAWLMRTSYVTATAVGGGSRAGTGGRAGALAAADEKAGAAPPLFDREALLREIDGTFAAARALDTAPPRHPTRPDELRAVAVRPVLPHARMAGNHHVLLTLSDDPLADCTPAAAFAKAARAKAKNGGEGGGEVRAALTPQEEDFLLSRAVTKSYKAARDPSKPTEEPEKFIGYMIPAEIPEGLFGGDEGDGNGADAENDAARRGDDAGNPSTSSSSPLRSLPFSGEYEWVREFKFRIEKGEAAAAAAGVGAGAGAKKRAYLLDLSSPSRKRKNYESGTDDANNAEPVRIVDLDTRLVAYSGKLDVHVPINRPSSISIRARERSAAETEAAKARQETVIGKSSG